MSGTCGIVGTGDGAHFGEAEIERMRSVLSQRGPDDQGLHVAQFGAGKVGLGHTRLSSINLNTGHQPLSNEDGTVWMAFNGEIYNFLELRPRPGGEGPSVQDEERHGGHRPSQRGARRRVSR